MIISGKQYRVLRKGRLKGKIITIDKSVAAMGGYSGSGGSLPVLAIMGNMAAYNAIVLDGYTDKEGPFYYGKIEYLGYIVSEKDLKELFYLHRIHVKLQ